jgi:hypothetical protein
VDEPVAEYDDSTIRVNRKEIARVFEEHLKFKDAIRSQDITIAEL